MGRDPELQKRLIQRVKEYHSKLDDVKAYGAKKYTTAFCIAKTADHFLFSTRTIENYIYS